MRDAMVKPAIGEKTFFIFHFSIVIFHFSLSCSASAAGQASCFAMTNDNCQVENGK
jgi:hypothetical protein